MIFKDIIFIHNEPNFAISAIKKNLEEDGYRVHEVPEIIAEIETVRDRANIILYHLSGISSQAVKVQEYLKLVVENEHKSLAIIGDSISLPEVRGVIGKKNIALEYRRPLDVRQLVSDMNEHVEAHMRISEQKLVLLVDDDPAFLKLVKDWLRPTYRVDMVTSGSEALKYLERVIPHLILMDYVMPQMSGPEVMDRIRSHHALARIPIIFLTGKDDRDSVMKVLDMKPDGYILKNTGREKFIETIDRFFVNHIMSNIKTESVR